MTLDQSRVAGTVVRRGWLTGTALCAFMAAGTPAVAQAVGDTAAGTTTGQPSAAVAAGGRSRDPARRPIRAASRTSSSPRASAWRASQDVPVSVTAISAEQIAAPRSHQPREDRRPHAAVHRRPRLERLGRAVDAARHRLARRPRSASSSRSRSSSTASITARAASSTKASSILAGVEILQGPAGAVLRQERDRRRDLDHHRRPDRQARVHRRAPGYEFDAQAACRRGDRLRSAQRHAGHPLRACAASKMFGSYFKNERRCRSPTRRLDIATGVVTRHFVADLARKTARQDEGTLRPR